MGVDSCNHKKQKMLPRTPWKKWEKKTVNVKNRVDYIPKLLGKAGKRKQALKPLTEQDSHKMLKAQIH